MNSDRAQPKPKTILRVARVAGLIVQILLLALAVFFSTYRLVRGGSEAATFRYEGF